MARHLLHIYIWVYACATAEQTCLRGIAYRRTVVGESGLALDHDVAVRVDGPAVSLDQPLTEHWQAL